MNVMLWKPGIDDGTTGELPCTGLGVLARDINDTGYDAFIADHHFDPVNDNAAINLLEKRRPDILCISLVSQEWPLPKTQAMLNTAYKMGVPIWIGGPHVHGYWDILEGDRRISKIVVGEADGLFEDILNNRERIVHLGRTDSFKPPDFTCMTNFQHMINYPIFTSRGCAHRCSFCAATDVHGNKWRSRPLDDSFWEEIDNIKRNYPLVTQISVIDDAFTADMDHARTFLEEYIKRGYHYKLSVFNVRADQIDTHLLVLMRQAGIETLAVGIESGDPEVYRLVRKGESLETIRNAIGLIQHAGIIPWLNMVIGLPGDSPEAHKRSLGWVASIPMPQIVQWVHFAPYRGTWAYRYFVKQGDIEDGFMPGFHGRYEELPEYGRFDAKGFNRREKMLAQLEAYLRCYSPILILNDQKVRRICKDHGMDHLYEDWKKNAPIKDFITNTLPNKVLKGQVRTKDIDVTKA